MNTLEAYSQNALAIARARHAANGQDMLASFFWNGMRYQVEVMRHEVAFLRTLPEVHAFCEMHNRQF